MAEKFVASPSRGEPRPKEFGREHSALERDIQELSQEVKEAGSEERTREVIRSSVAEKIYGPGVIPKPSASPAPPPPSLGSPLPHYAENLPAEVKLKVENLLDLVWHKGIDNAVKEVKKSDPLTMDLFHDAITEKLFNEFKRRGILK